MAGFVGVRSFGTKRDFYPYLEYPTKRKAQQVASQLRKRGFSARVVKSHGDWLVWATRR